MKWIKLCLLLVLLISSFGYGIGVGFYTWFPFDKIRMAKKMLIPDRNSNASLVEPVRVSKLPDKIISLNEQLSIFEANRLRSSLLQSIVPNNEIDVSVTSNEEFEIFETSYYGINVRGKFYHALTKSSCLRIYIQGHSGSPDDFDYYHNLKDGFLNSGCDVLSLSMIGIGFNIGQVSFPTRFGSVILTEEGAANHESYSLFFDKENPNLDALSIFLYPHMRLINYAINQDEYENISIMGISGGGWYTVWLAALMPELDISISYAGSLPFIYTINKKNFMDWEQLYSPIYKSVSYLQLYQLMKLNEIGKQTRQSFLVYNDNDPCCFSNPDASDFKSKIDKLKFYPQVIIDDSDKHSMNEVIILRLLQHGRI